MLVVACRVLSSKVAGATSNEGLHILLDCLERTVCYSFLAATSFSALPKDQSI